MQSQFTLYKTPFMVNDDSFDVSSTNNIDDKYEMRNGRILTSCETGRDFKLFEGNNNNTDNFKMNELKGIQQVSPLSVLYFSQDNIQRVQDLIRYNVYERTRGKYTIGEQSPTEIQIIMRAVYLQHAKGMSTNMRQQIIELNDITVSWAVPKIINEIEQFRGYVHDIENLPVPLEHPANLSSSGTKSLRSVTTTF